VAGVATSAVTPSLDDDRFARNSEGLTRWMDGETVQFVVEVDGACALPRLGYARARRLRRTSAIILSRSRRGRARALFQRRIRSLQWDAGGPLLACTGPREPIRLRRQGCAAGTTSLLHRPRSERFKGRSAGKRVVRPEA
jgi:hypothetical protein